MYDDINILEYIYEKAKIDQEILGEILKFCKINLNISNDYVDILKELLNNYKKVASSSKTMLERRNKIVKEVSILSKMAEYMVIKRNITQNSDISNISSILIQGNMINIDEINKKLNESKIKSKSIINLIQRYRIYEEDSIKSLNRFIDK